MKLHFVSVNVALVLMVSSLACSAQPPRFNYQAKLTDSGGVPLEGAHSLAFRIYQGGDAVTADLGTLMFEESVNLNLTGGIASHTVGTGTGQSPGPLTAA